MQIAKPAVTTSGTIMTEGGFCCDTGQKRVLHVLFCFQDQKRVIALYGERETDERRVKLQVQVSAGYDHGLGRQVGERREGNEGV